MEHQKRTTGTFDKASGFHPREDTDPRNIKTLNEESPGRGECYTVNYTEPINSDDTVNQT